MTDAELLANRSHPQPHSYLGAHPSDDRIVVRAFHPGAQEVTAVLDDGSRQPLEQTHPAGVFAAKITGRELPLPYRLDLTFDESGTFAIDDPLSSTVCKIGRSIKPKRRLPQLQTGNPDELILRHVIPGDLAAEQRLHHRFEPARIRGEWFGREYLPIILAFAGGLADRMIHTYDGSGTPPEMSGGDVRTAAEIQRIRRDIERLWRAGHDIDAIADYTWLEVDEVEQHLVEMRQSMIWDVQTPGGFYGGEARSFPTGRVPVPDGDRPRHKADDESLGQID